MAFDTNWLNSVYKQNLGRSADAAGADYWKSQYDTLGKSGIEYNIKQSEDAKKYLASQKNNTSGSSGGLLSGGMNTQKPRTASNTNSSVANTARNTSASAQSNSGFDQSRLNQIYQQQFGRDADTAGADYWRQQYDKLGMDGIEWNIKQQADKQGVTQASGGKATYQDAKAALEAAGKSTDTNSVLQYMSSVNSGQTTLGGGNAGQGAATTDRDRINQIYQQTLGRDADSAGADYWLSQVGNIGWDGVANQIRQGSEYQTGFTPRFTPTQVQPNQTVASQLDGLLASNSPLMQRAATQGMQVANSRGLLNSSMAAGAAQGAMIDRALPIASQDAQTQFQAAQADAGRNQQGLMADIAYQNQRGLNEQGYQFDIGRMQQQYGFSSALATQEAEQTLNQLYGTSNANAWGVMANNLTDIVGQYSSQLERIQMNPDIEEADKATLIEQVLAMRDTDIQFQKSLYEQLPTYLANTGVFPNR